MFTEAAMRARFHEIAARRKAILALSTPIREQRDKLTQECDASVSAMNADIKKIEADLFEMDMEAGRIARALGGKTGRVAA